MAKDKEAAPAAVTPPAATKRPEGECEIVVDRKVRRVFIKYNANGDAEVTYLDNSPDAK